MTHNEEVILGILTGFVSYITARSILNLAASRAGVDLARLRPSDAPAVLRELERGTKLYVHDPDRFAECQGRLARLLDPTRSRVSSQPMVVPVLQEQDIVLARAAGQKIAGELGFSKVDQTKIATAISELARNIVQYAGFGEIRLMPLTGERVGLEIIAADQGPGIPNLERILKGEFASARGLGLGLRGTRKLMDEFDAKSDPGTGTEITARKFAP